MFEGSNVVYYRGVFLFAPYYTTEAKEIISTTIFEARRTIFILARGLRELAVSPSDLDFACEVVHDLFKELLANKKRPEATKELAEEIVRNDNSATIILKQWEEQMQWKDPRMSGGRRG